MRGSACQSYHTRIAVFIYTYVRSNQISVNRESEHLLERQHPNNVRLMAYRDGDRGGGYITPGAIHRPHTVVIFIVFANGSSNGLCSNILVFAALGFSDF